MSPAKLVTSNVAISILVLILTGQITKPSQLKGEVDKLQLTYMSGAVTVENGDNDILTQLLTASVIFNRMQTEEWGGPTVQGVIEKKMGRYWQYASITRRLYKSKHASDLTKLLCKYVLIYGPVCPYDVVYQGQSKNGSNLFTKIKGVGGKYEYFCYE